MLSCIVAVLTKVKDVGGVAAKSNAALETFLLHSIRLPGPRKIKPHHSARLDRRFHELTKDRSTKPAKRSPGRSRRRHLSEVAARSDKKVTPRTRSQRTGGFGDTSAERPPGRPTSETPAANLRRSGDTGARFGATRVSATRRRGCK